MEKASSSSSSSSGGGTDSLNGLNFGKKNCFEAMSSGLHPKIGGEEEVGSPAKKGRTGVAHGGQPPLCQVEGCKVDLSGAKAYYSRHKVCGQHSKSPMVIVAGLEQRFCQQCSRFHQLPEFDQVKRSCRRRLAGHNERRRKPPPGPLLSSRYAALSPSLYDNNINTGGLSATDNHTNFQLPWQCCSQPPLPLLLQGSTTRPSYSGEDCFTGIPDSSSALSLLSNWGSTTHPLDLGVNNFLQTNGSAMAQPSLHTSWDFKDDDNCLLDMGLQQSLGLARPVDGVDQARGYDSSVHHMNWSL